MFEVYAYGALLATVGSWAAAVAIARSSDDADARIAELVL